MVKLKEICTINPKATTLADNLEVSFVPMPKVGEQGEFDPSEIKTYQEVKKGFTNFQNGDVLFAKITPCMENGKGAVAKSLKNGYGFGSTEFHVFRPDYSKVTSEWLYYLTSWDEFRKEAERNMTGSAGQKRVPKAFLENYDVNLPELQKQKEMAEILDRIGELIALRKEQLEKLDQLVKSRFIELFGSPIVNEYGWPVATLGELCLKITDGEHQNPQFVDSGIPMVMANNVQDKGVVFDGCRYISAENYMKFSRKCCPEFGDVLLVSRGATIGRCCINSESTPFSLMGSVILIKNNKERISSAYLVNWLKNEEIKPMIYTTSSASAQQAIYMKDLVVRKVAVPPMELQEQYTAFVEQTDKSKLAIQQSLDKLELLKKSLMQEYFG